MWVSCDTSLIRSRVSWAEIAKQAVRVGGHYLVGSGYHTSRLDGHAHPAHFRSFHPVGLYLRSMGAEFAQFERLEIDGKNL